MYEQGEIRQNNIAHSGENLLNADYPVFPGEGRLRLRLSGGEILRLQKEKQGTKAFYGTVLHDILSNIILEDDIQDAVDGAVNEGLLPVEMTEETIAKLRKMTGNPVAKQWFAPGTEVLTEPGIITGDGDIRRPDRVVIRDNKAIVIDYKFGEERLEHVRQIDYYKRLMAGLGYKVEKAVLWYVEHDKIIEV